MYANIFVDDKCQYVAMIESVKLDVYLVIHILIMRFVDYNIYTQRRVYVL